MTHCPTWSWWQIMRCGMLYPTPRQSRDTFWGKFLGRVCLMGLGFNEYVLTPTRLTLAKVQKTGNFFGSPLCGVSRLQRVSLDSKGSHVYRGGGLADLTKFYRTGRGAKPTRILLRLSGFPRSYSTPTREKTTPTREKTTLTLKKKQLDSAE